VGEVVRVRLDLGYDGTDFSGWAAQPGRRTVEAELSAALTTILRSPEPVRLTVAGRTDAGVHARGQVAHADVDADAWGQLPGRSERPPEEALRSRLAGVLADDVVVTRVCVASPGFDARFSATSRRYLYRLADDVATHDPLRRRDTVSVRGHLDAEAMNDAAYLLVGLHDFAAFCKQREGATTVRTLLALDWERGADAVDWPAAVLTGGVRDPGVRVMPPQGLSLEEVTYPPDDQLAARALETRANRILH
jgi:tRNA pseudouridine38-40 synthase